MAVTLYRQVGKGKARRYQKISRSCLQHLGRFACENEPLVFHHRANETRFAIEEVSRGSAAPQAGQL